MQRLYRFVLIACVLALPVGALRADPGPEAVPPTAGVARLDCAAEPDAALADLRGGLAGAGRAVARLRSKVSGNRVGAGTRTGAVSLSDAAISDIRGILVATFNTGNNASVQANLNVIVQLD